MLDSILNFFSIVDERSSAILILLGVVGTFVWLYAKERKNYEELIDKVMRDSQETVSTVNKMVNAVDRVRDSLERLERKLEQPKGTEK